MLRRILVNVLAGIGGIWIAAQFVSHVKVEDPFPQLLIMGGILGIVNTVVRPILNLLTFPLRILTLGLSSVVIDLILVFLVDLYFEKLSIDGLVPLFWTTVCVWGAGLLLSLLIPKR